MIKYILIIFLFFVSMINSQTKKINFYDPIVKTTNLIFENTFILGLKIVLIPIKPFFDYTVKKKIISRFISFTHIDKEKRQQIIPYFNLTTGRSSYIGVNYKYKGFLSKTSFRYQVSVNLNNRLILSYSKLNFIFPKTFFTTFIQQIISTQSSIVRPVTQFQDFYSNYTTTWRGVFNVIKKKISPYLGIGLTHFFYGVPKFEAVKVICESTSSTDIKTRCLDRRKGIGNPFLDFNYVIGLNYNTVNNQYTPYKGVFVNISLEDHLTTAKHNYRSWNLTFRQHIFLGVGRYRNIKKEKQSFKKMTIKQALKYVKIDYLSNQLWNKKTVIFQLKLKQSQEQRGHDLPIAALHHLSNETPLRGYSSVIKNNKNLISFSLEYRFPIAYFVEAVLFSDLADVNEELSDFNFLKAKRSFGFGFRMSRDDLFLFRLQFGFRSLGTLQINLNLNQTY